MRAIDLVTIEVPVLTVASALAVVRVRWASARRRERLARISHELRGPLQAVLLGLEGASRSLPAGGQPRFGAIEQELHRVVLAVEDLDAERGAGPQLARRTSVDLGALVAAQVEAWAPVAASFGRRLELAGPAAGVRVDADGRRVAQATGNLIANAIEHGRGTVRVAVLRTDGRISVVVDDDGPGLPRPLGALAARRRSGRGARGRGLAIADAVARRHGGRLVEQAARPGCRIALELPLAAPVAPIAAVSLVA